MSRLFVPSPRQVSRLSVQSAPLVCAVIFLAVVMTAIVLPASELKKDDKYYEKMYSEALSMNDPIVASKKFPELVTADVQKSKWIYMWQCFHHPGNQLYQFKGFFGGKHSPREKEYRQLKPPADYTGRWSAWNKKGVRFIEVELFQGQSVASKVDLGNGYVFYILGGYVAEDHIQTKLIDSVVSQYRRVVITSQEKTVHTRFYDKPLTFRIQKIDESITRDITGNGVPDFIYSTGYGRSADYYICELGVAFKILEVFEKTRIKISKADENRYIINVQDKVFLKDHTEYSARITPNVKFHFTRGQFEVLKQKQVMPADILSQRLAEAFKQHTERGTVYNFDRLMIELLYSGDLENAKRVISKRPVSKETAVKDTIKQLSNRPYGKILSKIYNWDLLLKAL